MFKATAIFGLHRNVSKAKRPQTRTFANNENVDKTLQHTSSNQGLPCVVGMKTHATYNYFNEM